MNQNQQVVVVDPESPWFNRTGVVVDPREMYFMVRFESDLGHHDRYMTPAQVQPCTVIGKLEVAPTDQERNMDRYQAGEITFEEFNARTLELFESRQRANARSAKDGAR